VKSSSAKTWSLGEIVELLGGEVLGDASLRVSQIASLEQAQVCHVSFLTGSRFLKKLEQSTAGAVIVGKDARDASIRPRIVCDNPYAYFARVSALLNPEPVVKAGVHASAVLDASVKIADSASIGPFVHIGADCVIGDGVVIDAGCVIGESVVIGAQTRLYPRVVIYHGCQLGERVILHSGAVIGADGFGWRENGRWLQFPRSAG
jgi:UDP-3-O-[3-hydroxymyristoyl] glucosamine N-acyltransferase